MAEVGGRGLSVKGVRAWANAIIGGRRDVRPVHLGNEAVLAVGRNFTAELERAALSEFGESGLKLVRIRAGCMRGQSVLEDVMDQRLILKAQLGKGSFRPKRKEAAEAHIEKGLGR